jgi:hypothetical protein
MPHRHKKSLGIMLTIVVIGIALLAAYFIFYTAHSTESKTG